MTVVDPEIEFTYYSYIFMEKSWEWLNDKEIKLLTLTPDFTKIQQIEFFNSLPNRKDYYIRGIIRNNKPIGACGLKKISEKDAEYWGYIGEKEYWGQGIGKEIMKYIINIAKEKQLNSIYLQVSKTNIRAIRLYTKSGFNIENANETIITMQLTL
jgi:RimJ/RimL family protein N-acetyltransferase